MEVIPLSVLYCIPIELAQWYIVSLLLYVFQCVQGCRAYLLNWLSDCMQSSQRMVFAFPALLSVVCGSWLNSVQNPPPNTGRACLMWAKCRPLLVNPDCWKLLIRIKQTSTRTAESILIGVGLGSFHVWLCVPSWVWLVYPEPFVLQGFFARPSPVPEPV